MPGHRIVGFIAMHIDQQPTIGGNFHQGADAFATIGHGPFEMGNATHYIDAFIECAGKLFRRILIPQITVLRESNELQIDIEYRLPTSFGMDDMIIPNFLK